MEWISVNDNLPALNEKVLVCLETGEYCIAFISEYYYGDPMWAVNYNKGDYYTSPEYWCRIVGPNRGRDD